MVMEFEPTTTEPHATNVDVEMDGSDCIDDEMEATQRFEDEPAEVETAAAPSTPAVTAPETAEADGSFAVAGASESAKPFSAAFGTVWQVLASLGWQTAQGLGTEFVSMPGTQFFNFRPNINVFDSKGKACWKWLATAADREPTPTEEEPVWETLWTIAEKQFGWYTMSSGNETWFVKPNTQFTEFQPNVTIFQTKKRAVLQALAINKVKIELGDSVEGKQVIDFAAKPEESKPKAKKEKSTETPNKTKSKSDSFTTPPPKKSATSASSSGKKTATSSGKKAGKSPGSGKKATTPAKKNVKSPKTPKSAKKSADEEAEAKPKPEPPLQFHVPEFKCTFAHVYKTLQERGWHHKPGSFEYDYFSPDYTKETQILNGNYFQSAAEFEGFLKDSGMWADIEAELREEHAALVEELRQEAEKKRQKQKERQAAKEAMEKAKAKSKPTPAKEAKTPRSPLKKKKKSAFTASIEASKALAASSGTKREAPKEVKITMGKVVEKLVKRGWHYRPGRFEYDYFKPNVTIKNGKAGEDYFQSLSELEEYLKTTELWDEISYEIRNGSDDEEEDEEDTRKKATPPPAKKQRVEPPVAKSPREEKRSPTEPLEPAAAALSNDIWGNSHQIDFEKY